MIDISKLKVGDVIRFLESQWDPPRRLIIGISPDKDLIFMKVLDRKPLEEEPVIEMSYKFVAENYEPIINIEGFEI